MRNLHGKHSGFASRGSLWACAGVLLSFLLAIACGSAVAADAEPVGPVGPVAPALPAGPGDQSGPAMAAPHDAMHDAMHGAMGAPQGQGAPNDETTRDGTDMAADTAGAVWSPLDFAPIEHLAVQQEGRLKPLDTVAREAIAQITGQALFSGGSNFKNPETGHSVDAVDLFLSIWLNARDWNAAPVVFVGSMAFRQELGLSTDSGMKLFSVNTLTQPECWNKLMALYQSGHEKQMRKAQLTSSEKEASDVMERLSRLQDIQQGTMLTIVPHPSKADGAWTLLTAAPYAPEQMAPVRRTFDAMRAGYYARDNAQFVKGSVAFVESVNQLSPNVYPSMPTLETEIFYNHLHPFRYAWLLYLVGALMTAGLFRFKTKWAYGLSIAPFLMAFGLHAYGIYLRCAIAGRPPVTNMYESVVWVGAGCAFFGLVFELIHRPRYYMLAASVMAVLTLLLADNVPVITGAGKNIGPLVPVLRDNFWLTVHVLTITLSYAAFTLAWSLGHITLFKHLIHPQTTTEHKELHGFLYRVLMLGVLLLAAGTILGGVWANYSWGRFWGWDPKETWALIALLTYLVVLHGRYTGLWGYFGLSVGSVVCYLSVLMAWYGVNFVLGTGLHSYGFGAADGLPYVIGFVGLDSAFVAAVLIRRSRTGGAAQAAEVEDGEADPADAQHKADNEDHPWAKPDATAHP